MDWEEEEKKSMWKLAHTVMPLQQSSQWSDIIQFSEVFLAKYYLNCTTLLPWWLWVIMEWHLSFYFFLHFLLLPFSLLLLSLRLHISQCSAFGITPLKSLTLPVPAAAMTTVGEPREGSESVSVIVCLIANLWTTCACMCTVQTLFFSLGALSFCTCAYNCRSAYFCLFTKLKPRQQHRILLSNYRAGWHL